MADLGRRVVLVGMGVDAAAREADLTLVAHETGARLAYLQVGTPSLFDVLDDLAATAPGAIVSLVPAPTAGSSSPARSWLRRVAGEWVRRHPGALDIRVAHRAVSGREAGVSSPAFETVPAHKRHVLVCRGPRCTALGASDTARAVSEALRERSMGDDDVLVTQTGCLYPCNHGPVVVIHPDDTWYGPVDGAAAARIVAAHLVAGEPVDGRRLPRAASNNDSS